LSSTRPANHHPAKPAGGSTVLPGVFRTALRPGIAPRVHDELDAPRATVTDVERRQIRRKPVLGGLINEYTHAA